MRMPKDDVDERVQNVGAEEIVIASGGGNEPAEREAFFHVADGEVVAIGFESEQMTLRAPDEAGGTGRLFVIGNGDANFDQAVVE